MLLPDIDESVLAVPPDGGDSPCERLHLLLATVVCLSKGVVGLQEVIYGYRGAEVARVFDRIDEGGLPVLVVLGWIQSFFIRVGRKSLRASQLQYAGCE